MIAALWSLVAVLYATAALMAAGDADRYTESRRYPPKRPKPTPPGELPVWTYHPDAKTW